MRLALDPCDYHPFFRELFRVGGSRFRVGAGNAGLEVADDGVRRDARAGSCGRGAPHRHPRLARAAFHTPFPWLEE